jgi:quercetin dioxygenase-like cupin family protein
MGAANRVFALADCLLPAEVGPVRSVVLETDYATIVAWHVSPRQQIAAHIHPRGQDTWTVMSGEAIYCLGDSASVRLKAGDIAVAKPGEVHGALNFGAEPFVFVSVVSGKNPGDELVN